MGIYSPKAEGQHEGEFLAEAVLANPHNYCFEEGILSTGQVVKDGQLVELSSTKLIAKSTTVNTSGFTVPVEGIIVGNHDTTSNGPFGAGDKRVVYLKRGPAVVFADRLTYPSEGTEAQALADLEELGIIAR